MRRNKIKWMHRNSRKGLIAQKVARLDGKEEQEAMAEDALVAIARHGLAFPSRGRERWAPNGV